MAYQVSDLAEAMRQDSGIALKQLKVDGGACANDFLMQFQADILETDIVRPECIETTALGAAYLAGLAVGYWEGLDDIKQNWKVSRVFKKQMEESRRRELLKGWKRAVRCAVVWGNEAEKDQ